MTESCVALSFNKGNLDVLTHKMLSNFYATFLHLIRYWKIELMVSN